MTPSLTTVYTVTGTASGCSSTKTVQVIVNPLPILSTTASPVTICQGFTSNLTASGGVTYTWMPGSLTGSNVFVGPTVTATYTLTGASAFGCISTGTQQVIVNPIPNITVTALPSTVCAGSSSTLSAIGASSYTFSSLSNIVTPSVTTVYTVTGTSSLGCLSAPVTVTVFVISNPVITASASPAAICPGGSSTLSAVGASSFVWSTSVTSSSIIVSPSLTTTYSVAGVVGTCSSNIVTLTVVVNSLPSISVSATSSAICFGTSATMTASGASIYTWNPGGFVGPVFTVTPSVSTNYTVTGINGSGCISSTNFSLVVNPNPTLSTSASPSVICSGQSSSLSVTAPAANYTWNPGNLNGALVVVNPTVTTTYTVVALTVSGCTGTAVQTVSVNPLPVISATATPASICIGNSSTLTASGGTAYSWSPGPLTGSVVVVSPTVNTAYIVTGTSSIGCSNTATAIVTVNSVPTISITASSNTICSGSSATLSGSGTLTYSWSPGGSTNTVIVVSPSVTTVYTLNGSNGFGCSSVQLFTLVVNATPTINITSTSTTICSGQTLLLTANGANSYNWSPAGGSGTTALVNPTSTTVYTVTGTSSGCSASNTFTLIVNQLPTITAVASPTNICSGFSSTLTAGGAIGYSWTPPFTTGSLIVVSPTTTTDYTVYGIDALNCINSQTINLLVTPTPTVSAIASPTAICIGSSGNLIGSGALNYTWQPGALNGSNVAVNPTVTTTYTVTGDNGASCNNSNTVTVFVNPLPIISAVASSTAVCSGSSVSLTASGGINYTWTPGLGTGSTVVDNPTITATYTVLGEDANTCLNTATVSVLVNPLPTLTTVATPSTICFGTSLTLSSSGAITYTWNPTGLNGAVITDSPNVTTTYTVSGTDALGCIGTDTVIATVVPIPTLSVLPNNATVCVGTSATLTASGAASYTWLPSNNTNSVEVVTPLITTNYTVIGDNGGNCPTTFTVDVFVNPLPANLTASCSGIITCTTQAVNLFGGTTNTNVSYFWNGPTSYTSAVQNPTGITVWGDYTLSVTDNNTGCVGTVTVNVPTDNSIPSVTATTSGSITCAVSSVTLNAANTTTNAGYNWGGPAGFTSTVQTFTVGVAGNYSVIVTDQTSGCASIGFVTVGIHTVVTITSTISPATCSLGISNNDGSIKVAGFGALDKFDIVAGTSYTGTATYTNATTIPTNSLLTNNLANPTTTLAFTVRLFDAQGCIKDTTLLLVPIDCIPKILGIAKSVSTPSLNTDGSYNINYKVVVKNYSSGALTNVNLNENLNNTFPLPTTYTLLGQPVLKPTASGLILNTAFDGSGQTNLLASSTSSMLPNVTDTIIFALKVKTNGVFGPFKNTVTATAIDNFSVTVRDSSNTGTNPDPDGDNNPNNNNIATSVQFIPNLFFGLTKVGSVEKLNDNSYNLSYTVTVHNFGNDTLRSISVNDSLFGRVIKAPATYSVISGPFASGSLVANSSYNGNTVSNLLNPLLSKMLPGTSSNISFVINVVPNSSTSISINNSAIGTAVSVISGSNITVRDTSNTGLNPDVNGNGVWNEPIDNVPTTLVISALIIPVTETLFIPQAISPNGDGINDSWAIKGLPTDGDNEVTIYNRWGNRVYYHANYSNAIPWDGTPNVAGTLGDYKLPEGTYYYVLEMKGSGIKTKTGFIVLQYQQ